MSKLAAGIPLIMAAGLLAALGSSALAFNYLAVNVFEVGTDREYIPELKRSSTRPQCAKQR